MLFDDVVKEVLEKLNATPLLVDEKFNSYLADVRTVMSSAVDYDKMTVGMAVVNYVHLYHKHFEGVVELTEANDEKTANLAEIMRLQYIALSEAAKRGLMADHDPRRDFPFSSDWGLEIDCRSVSCIFNDRTDKCLIPSKCSIGNDGRCGNFEMRPSKSHGG